MTAIPSNRVSYPRESPLKLRQKHFYQNFAKCEAKRAERLLARLLDHDGELTEKAELIAALRDCVKEMDYLARKARGDANPETAFLI